MARCFAFFTLFELNLIFDRTCPLRYRRPMHDNPSRRRFDSGTFNRDSLRAQRAQALMTSLFDDIWTLN